MKPAEVLAKVYHRERTISYSPHVARRLCNASHGQACSMNEMALERVKVLTFMIHGLSTTTTFRGCMTVMASSNLTSGYMLAEELDSDCHEDAPP